MYIDNSELRKEIDELPIIGEIRSILNQLLNMIEDNEYRIHRNYNEAQGIEDYS